jgi:hypothetical protein
LSVVGRTAVAGGDSAWVVRFADPVIVNTYVVDPRTRMIVESRTTQRRNGTVLHYVRATSATAPRRG